jgi:hypothetical protein
MATRGAGLDLEAIGVLAAREGVDEVWETMLRREE